MLPKTNLVNLNLLMALTHYSANSLGASFFRYFPFLSCLFMLLTISESELHWRASVSYASFFPEDELSNPSTSLSCNKAGYRQATGPLAAVVASDTLR
jgi:hypothetical protein